MGPSKSNEYLLKICAFGSGNTGKTDFIRRFAEDKFDGNYLPTLGVDITTKKLMIGGKKVKLILVDTAGQEFFGKLRPSYYRGGSAGLVICNIHDRKTIEEIPNWIKEFRNHIPTPSIPMAIAIILNEVEKPKYYASEPKRVTKIKRKRRNRFIRQLLKRFRRNKSKRKKQRVKKRISRDTIPEEWASLSNFELADHIAKDYEIKLYKIDLDLVKTIPDCFIDLAQEVIR